MTEGEKGHFLIIFTTVDRVFQLCSSLIGELVLLAGV